MNHGEIVSFLWGVADLIRDTFKRGKYQDVILPLTVLRRLDCVLEKTKGKVLESHAKLKGKLENLDPQLRNILPPLLGMRLIALIVYTNSSCLFCLSGRQ
jgi:type I restriction-modification system DNA methylase subunit